MFRITFEGQRRQCRYEKAAWERLTSKVHYLGALTRFHGLRDGGEICFDGTAARLFDLIDDFAHRGSFSRQMLRPDVFRDLLPLVDFLQVEGADEDLAAAVDEGMVFYPEARYRAAICSPPSADDAFVSSVRWLYNVGAHLPRTKLALNDLAVFLQTHDQLYRRLPVAFVLDALATPRRFGLARDALRLALVRFRDGANFPGLFLALEAFRNDWPAEFHRDSVPAVFTEASRSRAVSVLHRVFARWLLDGAGDETFYASENASVIRKRVLDKMRSVSESSLLAFLRETFIESAPTSLPTLDCVERYLRRPGRIVPRSCLFVRNDGLYEYNRYVRRFRLLALKPPGPVKYLLALGSTAVVWLGSMVDSVALDFRCLRRPGERYAWQPTNGIVSPALPGGLIVSNRSVDDDVVVFLRATADSWDVYALRSFCWILTGRIRGTRDLRACHTVTSSGIDYRISLYVLSATPTVARYEYQWNYVANRSAFFRRWEKPLPRPDVALDDLDLVRAPNGSAALLHRCVRRAQRFRLEFDLLDNAGRWTKRSAFSFAAADVNVDFFARYSVVTTEENVVIRDAEIQPPGRNAFGGRILLLNFRSGEARFRRPFAICPRCRPSKTVCVNENVFVPSSRLGFWVDGPQPPDDIVDWEALARQDITLAETWL